MSTSKHQRDHRARKRAKGICAYGGCKVFTGRAVRCPNHAAKAARDKLMRRLRGLPQKDLEALRDKYRRMLEVINDEVFLRMAGATPLEA